MIGDTRWSEEVPRYLDWSDPIIGLMNRALAVSFLDPARWLSPRSSADDPPVPSLAQSPERRTYYRWVYMLAGLVLALGAPAGALLLRQGQEAGSPFDDLFANAFFYLYMLIGTSLVFGAAGFVAGMIADSLAQERDRFHELSEHDELTGLLNARAFWDRYRRAVDKTARFQEPLALLIIDVDQLKVFNDQEGHRFGDKVLQHVGRAVGKAKRADDVAARWGGDEFAILMRGAPSSAAVRVGEALLGQMRQELLRTSRTERVVGITIGIATTERGSAEGLFDRADRALYAGKRGGGNQISVADDLATTPESI